MTWPFLWPVFDLSFFKMSQKFDCETSFHIFFYKFFSPMITERFERWERRQIQTGPISSEETTRNPEKPK